MRSFLFICILLTGKNIFSKLATDDIDIIRQRVLKQMIWPVKGNILITVQNTLLYTETLNKSYYWPAISGKQ